MGGVHYLDPVIILNQKICPEDSSGQIIFFAVRDLLESYIVSNRSSYKDLTKPLIHCYFCALAEVENNLGNSSANFGG